MLTPIPDFGWQAALEAYNAVADDLHAGRTPRVDWDASTVAELCNRFLTAKQRKVDAGELGLLMFQEHKATTDLIVANFGRTRAVAGLAAEDFEKLRAVLARRYGLVRLGNTITRVKTVFKYGFDNGLFDRPVRYGCEFEKPDKAVLRRHRAQRGPLMLEAVEIHRLLAAADVQLRAMILLGVNCEFGNTDCASLPLSALDLDGGWISFPRPKTRIARRCPLWPETVAALQQALAVRPKPKQDAGSSCVFLNQRGLAFVHHTKKGKTDALTVRFGRLLRSVGIERPRIGFYTLRHVFRTIADAARDRVAIDLIMGHADPSMGAHYRERVEDARLRAVAEHVREWLFAEAKAE